jgi:hypothetical protein
MDFDYELYLKDFPLDGENETFTAIRELVVHIEAYDKLRLQIQDNGGTLKDLQRISDHLNQSVCLASPYGSLAVALVDQEELKSALKKVDWNLHLDVRQNHLGMPLYYLCRTHDDIFGRYRLIVEDYVKSADYIFDDARFVKLMLLGHEVYYLRLSQFRDDAECEFVRETLNGRDGQVDTVLYDVGRYVLGSAWHEDQILGIVCARHFKLTKFHQAIELLYLILSGEPSEIRCAVNDDMLTFFDIIYPQRSIQLFLMNLNRMQGYELSRLPVVALSFYKELSVAFSRFLSVSVPWGFFKNPISLWKIVYGNYYRLEIVAKALDDDPGLKNAAQKLEDAADHIISKLVQKSA